MNVEDLVLLGGFAAIALFGYYIMWNLDNFFDKAQQKHEKKARTTGFHIATSSFAAIPAASNILKELKHQYPDVHCVLSLGHEQEVIQSFDRGDADVAILSVDSDEKSGTPAQRSCITLDPQSLSIENGAVEIKTLENDPQPQKVLWNNSGNPSLVQSFLHHLWGQRQ